MNIVINGSFLKHKVTGMTRYAREITKRILEYENVYIACEQKTYLDIGPNKIFHIPQSWVTQALGSSKVWSQVDVPRYIGSHVLWSPTNIGPLGVKNHVVTIHDLSPLEHPEWFRPGIVGTCRFYLPRLAKQAKAILTDSKYFRNRLIERFGLSEERVKVVPCGVDPRFRPCTQKEVVGIQKRYGLPERYFLSLGSLEPRKNLLNLFRAWKSLSSEVRGSVALVVAGDRDKVFAYQDYSTLVRKTPNVTFTGYFPDEDLPALYSGALGLVYPSLYEGFGLPPLEAMACGTPVITCSNTTLPEVVGESALFVEPLKPESIAAGIQTLIESQELQLSLSQAGLEQVKHFSWDQSAHMVYEILNRLRP